MVLYLTAVPLDHAIWFQSSAVMILSMYYLLNFVSRFLANIKLHTIFRPIFVFILLQQLRVLRLGYIFKTTSHKFLQDSVHQKYNQNLLIFVELFGNKQSITF